MAHPEHVPLPENDNQGPDVGDIKHVEVPRIEDYLVESSEVVQEPANDTEGAPDAPDDEPSYEYTPEEVEQLERGGVVIKPLEGDPFTLDKTPEAANLKSGEVLIRDPDGTMRVESYDEHMENLAASRQAAYYVKSRMPEQSVAQNDNKPGLGKQTKEWVKGKVKKLWSWLFG
jgi:hypothetical protein